MPGMGVGPVGPAGGFGSGTGEGSGDGVGSESVLESGSNVGSDVEFGAGSAVGCAGRFCSSASLTGSLAMNRASRHANAVPAGTSAAPMSAWRNTARWALLLHTAAHGTNVRIPSRENSPSAKALSRWRAGVAGRDRDRSAGARPLRHGQPPQPCPGREPCRASDATEIGARQMPRTLQRGNEAGTSLDPRCTNGRRW
jgi:hypothetical protein